MKTQDALRRVFTNTVVGAFVGALTFAVLSLLPALIFAVVTDDFDTDPVYVALGLTLAGGLLGAFVGGIVYPISVEIIESKDTE